MAEVLRLGAPYLTAPKAAGLWLLLLVGLPIWALREEASLRLALSFVPLVPITFVVMLLFGSPATEVGRTGSTSVALVVAAVFVDYFTSHAVRMLLGRSVLTPEKRQYLRKLWDGRWGFWVGAGLKAALEG